jgi:hypothetical protein
MVWALGVTFNPGCSKATQQTLSPLTLDGQFGRPLITSKNTLAATLSGLLMHLPDTRSIFLTSFAMC